MNKKQHILYRDIDLSLTPHPLTGDISVRTNAEAVKKSIIHALLLEPHDIPFEPDVHSHVRERLFDNPNSLVITTLYKSIEWAVKRLEPRVEIRKLDIQISSDESGYNIDIEYYIKSLYITDQINYFFKRVR